jgi:hypothetical protein
MDPRSGRGAGWVAFSAIVLTIAGIFGIIDGLMAVYRSAFFTTNAVFVFSDLRAWGWITFGLGVAGVASGLAVVSGREWARWTGVFVASLSAIGQLMFAQAYPLWSLMIMALDFLVIYGLVAYGGRRAEAGALSSRDTGETSADAYADRPVTDMGDQSRRAA